MAESYRENQNENEIRRVCLRYLVDLVEFAAIQDDSLDYDLSIAYKTFAACVDDEFPMIATCPVQQGCDVACEFTTEAPVSGFAATAFSPDECAEDYKGSELSHALQKAVSSKRLAIILKNIRGK